MLVLHAVALAASAALVVEASIYSRVEVLLWDRAVVHSPALFESTSLAFSSARRGVEQRLGDLLAAHDDLHDAKVLHFVDADGIPNDEDPLSSGANAAVGVAAYRQHTLCNTYARGGEWQQAHVDAAFVRVALRVRHGKADKDMVSMWLARAGLQERDMHVLLITPPTTVASTRRRSRRYTNGTYGVTAQQACRNGGWKAFAQNDHDTVGSQYHCNCPDGFYGPDCRYIACQNGGVPARDGANLYCHCPPGYNGLHCEPSVCKPKATRAFTPDSHTLAIGVTAGDLGDLMIDLVQVVNNITEYSCASPSTDFKYTYYAAAVSRTFKSVLDGLTYTIVTTVRTNDKTRFLTFLRQVDAQGLVAKEQDTMRMLNSLMTDARLQPHDAIYVFSTSPPSPRDSAQCTPSVRAQMLAFRTPIHFFIFPSTTGNWPLDLTERPFATGRAYIDSTTVYGSKMGSTKYGLGYGPYWELAGNSGGGVYYLTINDTVTLFRVLAGTGACDNLLEMAPRARNLLTFDYSRKADMTKDNTLPSADDDGNHYFQCNRIGGFDQTAGVPTPGTPYQYQFKFETDNRHDDLFIFVQGAYLGDSVASLQVTLDTITILPNVANLVTADGNGLVNIYLVRKPSNGQHTVIVKPNPDGIGQQTSNGTAYPVSVNYPCMIRVYDTAAQSTYLGFTQNSALDSSAPWPTYRGTSDGLNYLVAGADTYNPLQPFQGVQLRYSLMVNIYAAATGIPSSLGGTTALTPFATYKWQQRPGCTFQYRYDPSTNQPQICAATDNADTYYYAKVFGTDLTTANEFEEAFAVYCSYEGTESKAIIDESECFKYTPADHLDKTTPYDSKTGQCNCASMWTGALCEVPLCLNGGTLTDQLNCTCVPPWTGVHCELTKCNASAPIPMADERRTLSIVFEAANSMFEDNLGLYHAVSQLLVASSTDGTGLADFSCYWKNYRLTYFVDAGDGSSSGPRIETMMTDDLKEFIQFLGYFSRFRSGTRVCRQPIFEGIYQQLTFPAKDSDTEFVVGSPTFVFADMQQTQSSLARKRAADVYRANAQYKSPMYFFISDAIAGTARSAR